MGKVCDRGILGGDSGCVRSDRVEPIRVGQQPAIAGLFYAEAGDLRGQLLPGPRTGSGASMSLIFRCRRQPPGKFRATGGGEAPIAGHS